MQVARETPVRVTRKPATQTPDNQLDSPPPKIHRNAATPQAYILDDTEPSLPPPVKIRRNEPTSPETSLPQIFANPAEDDFAPLTTTDRDPAEQFPRLPGFIGDAIKGLESRLPTIAPRLRDLIARQNAPSGVPVPPPEPPPEPHISMPRKIWNGLLGIQTPKISVRIDKQKLSTVAQSALQFVKENETYVAAGAGALTTLVGVNLLNLDPQSVLFLSKNMSLGSFFLNRLLKAGERLPIAQKYDRFHKTALRVTSITAKAFLGSAAAAGSQMLYEHFLEPNFVEAAQFNGDVNTTTDQNVTAPVPPETKIPTQIATDTDHHSTSVPTEAAVPDSTHAAAAAPIETKTLEATTTSTVEQTATSSVSPTETITPTATSTNTIEPTNTITSPTETVIPDSSTVVDGQTTPIATATNTATTEPIIPLEEGSPDTSSSNVGEEGQTSTPNNDAAPVVSSDDDTTQLNEPKDSDIVTSSNDQPEFDETDKKIVVASNSDISTASTQPTPNIDTANVDTTEQSNASNGNDFTESDKKEVLDSKLDTEEVTQEHSFKTTWGGPTVDKQEHTIQGSATEGNLMYDDKVWQMVPNGEKNIEELMNATNTTGYTINQEKLTEAIDEGLKLIESGQLKPGTDLYKAIHLMNGTEKIYKDLLSADTIQSLKNLGVITL